MSTLKYLHSYRSLAVVVTIKHAHTHTDTHLPTYTHNNPSTHQHKESSHTKLRHLNSNYTDAVRTVKVSEAAQGEKVLLVISSCGL